MDHISARQCLWASLVLCMSLIPLRVIAEWIILWGLGFGFATNSPCGPATGICASQQQSIVRIQVGLKTPAHLCQGSLGELGGRIGSRGLWNLKYHEADGTAEHGAAVSSSHLLFWQSL